MDPSAALQVVGSLGPTGVVVVALWWIVQRLDAQRASEREASKAIMDAHLAQFKEIAETSRGAADSVRGAVTALHEVIGEIRGVSRAGEKA